MTSNHKRIMEICGEYEQYVEAQNALIELTHIFSVLPIATNQHLEFFRKLEAEMKAEQTRLDEERRRL